MPATNLLYVSRGNVFNCFDQIAGYTKKRYIYTQYNYPNITEALQSNTVLVVVSHGNTAGIESAAHTRVNATTFVQECLFPRIDNRHKISKVVFLVCSAGNNFGSANFHQLAPDQTLHFDPPNLYVESGEAQNPPGQGLKTINNILGLTESNSGWQYLPKE